MASKDDIPWKLLGVCQLILFLLTLLTFLDMQARIETTRIECGCLDGSEEREKRSLKGMPVKD
jgi:hypothetical protein